MKIKQILEGLTDEQVDQFHTELDDLVHKHLGHSSDEEEHVEESEEKPYICVHAKKGKYECHADSSYGAAKKAAAHWKLKSTAGIDAHLAVEEEALTEEQFDEAAGEKDACYHKVKSRYKVWPSAYASGALVQCRKVGAKNWGNKSKK